MAGLMLQVGQVLAAECVVDLLYPGEEFCTVLRLSETRKSGRRWQQIGAFKCKVDAGTAAAEKSGRGSDTNEPRGRAVVVYVKSL